MFDDNVRRFAAGVLVLAWTFADDAVGAQAGAAATGDLWETTSQMTMPGMPMAMPASKVKVCSPKVWHEPPGARAGCTNSNVQSSGSTMTWTVQCPEMSGVGEITRNGSDAYAGTIKFTSAQGAMTVNLSGQKIGECDHPQ